MTFFICIGHIGNGSGNGNVNDNDNGNGNGKPKYVKDEHAIAVSMTRASKCRVPRVPRIRRAALPRLTFSANGINAHPGDFTPIPLYHILLPDAPCTAISLRAILVLVGMGSVAAKTWKRRQMWHLDWA